MNWWSKRKESELIPTVNVQLDWTAGEEHLPLLHLSYLIDKKEIDHGIKLNLIDGTGSCDSLKAIEYTRCDVSLCGAITFLEHAITNQNIMTVGSYIRKPPIVILVNLHSIGSLRDKLMAMEEVEDSSEEIGLLFNDQKIAVLPNSVAMDWLRYFTKNHDLKPRSIVQVESTREYGTNVLHNVSCLICYEYNQAIEVLCDADDNERFCKILLRDTPRRWGKIKSIILKSYKIDYHKMPGVVFAANCTAISGEGGNILKNKLGRFFCALQKSIHILKDMEIGELDKLARHISEHFKGKEVAYIPARGRPAANAIIWERLKMLKKIYWGTPINWQMPYGDPRENWLQVAGMCNIPAYQIKHANTPGTGIWYDIEIPKDAC